VARIVNLFLLHSSVLRTCIGVRRDRGAPFIVWAKQQPSSKLLCQIGGCAITIAVTPVLSASTRPQAQALALGKDGATTQALYSAPEQVI
jgi:hypothetical protein